MGACSSCGAAVADDARFCAACGASLATPTAEVRKTVTVLFCDVVGSTALGDSADPEVLRATLARYFERMKTIVERHGGTVEKFIGDAVMAVFGLPAAHEDDALRALRAAHEMRASWPDLGIEARIGITTGEVVAGTAERLATGDAVNVATRLQQTAAPGEVLCAEVTLRLAGDAVEAEPVPPLELKGKQRPVTAARVLAVSVLSAQRAASDAALVGRSHELSSLDATWRRGQENAKCEALTVLGAPGVGKSRLVSDFLAGIPANVVRSRCLPYGEGITYWPVVGIVKQLDEHRSSLEPAAARSIDVLLGAPGTTSSDEIAWAVRKLLEVAAADPLVVVIDDIQWGEDPFLDLLEHVALMAAAPIFLLCMARPELLDKRPDWPGVLRLEALSAHDAQALLDDRLREIEVSEQTRARVLANAAGNPLFVEEMAAMLADSPDAADVVVPPTIQALLAARLDQLDSGERTVLEHGAVEGEVFHRGVVHALTPQESRLTGRLIALVRRELVRPDRPTLARDDAYRFRHLLVRDAAYDSIAKSRRADLHERLADWLERAEVDLIELDEIVGYHFEQAYRYRSELGVDAEDVADRAARHLIPAGRRALAHGDVGAALNLLQRAYGLLPDPARDIDLEWSLGNALFFSGRLDECFALAEAAEKSATARGDRRAELFAQIEKVATLYWQGRAPAEDVLAVCREALPFFEQLGDEQGLMRAWGEMGAAVGERSAQAAVEPLERAVQYAERLGEHFYRQTCEYLLAVNYSRGPTPIPEVLAWMAGRTNRTLVRMRAIMEAGLGHLDEARALIDEASRYAHDTGDQFGVGTCANVRSVIEGFAGDADAELAWARRGYETFAAMEANAWLPSSAGRLSLLLAQRGDDDEAEELARLAEQRAGANDDDAQQIWRLARAMLLAKRGGYDDAVHLAEEAVAIVGDTDILPFRAETLLHYADVLSLCGHDAATPLRAALELYERKGNVVMTARTRERLAALETV